MEVLERPLGTMLEQVEIGPVSGYEAVTMLPLLMPAVHAPDPGYRTLDEAQQEGKIRITEVSRGGSVPELRLENLGDIPVLLLDGEELVGAKQNRIVNLTILAPAKEAIRIPVSCVEQGRWSYASETFAAAPRTHFAEGRRRKMAAVSASMRTEGGRHADQGEVWAGIAEKAARLEAHSPTGAMADLYERHSADIEAYVRAFPPVEGQVGALFAIGGGIAGMDLFDHPATLRRLLPKLVRSYALDAVDPGGRMADPTPTSVGPASPIRVAALGLLAAAASARVDRFKAIGLGEDVRLSGEGITGGALAFSGRIIHLAAFALEGEGAEAEPAGPAAGREARISRPSRRRVRYSS